MNEILTEVKKAIDLWMDKTYNEAEFYSHILAIIRDNSGSADAHREQLERLILKVEEMRESQRMYHGGHKSYLGRCKSQEVEMDKKIMYLLTTKGYDISRFKKEKPEQKTMF